jgi:hypothetical protein
MPQSRLYWLTILATVATLTAQPRNGTIAGRVMDAQTDEPLVGASVGLTRLRFVFSVTGSPNHSRVSFDQPPGSLQTFVTGSDGAFAFQNVPEGRYSIWVIHAGHQSGGYGATRPGGQSQHIWLSEGEARTGLEIALWKRGAIEGRVVDDAGDPVVGVDVAAFRALVLDGTSRYAAAAWTRTDDQGRYRFAELWPGEYLVGLPSTALTWPGALGDQLASGDADLAVEISETFSLSGALAPPASPLRTPEALVGFRGPEGRLRDAEGPDARPRLVVYPTAFYPAAGIPTLAMPLRVDPGDALQAIDFQLQPVETVSVSGTFVGPVVPASGTAVRLVPDGLAPLTSTSRLETAITTTDAAARFAFLGVPPGQYRLQVRAGFGAWWQNPVEPGGLAAALTSLSARPPPSTTPLQWADLPVAVADTDVTGLRVALQRGLRVQGRFEFEGVSDRAALDRLLTRTSFWIDDVGVTGRLNRPHARTQPDGTFLSDEYPPGTYRSWVMSPPGWLVESVTVDGRDVHAGQIELTDRDLDGIVVVLTDKENTLGGTVRRSADDERSLAVLVFPQDLQTWIDTGMSPVLSRTSVIDPDGTFMVRGLRPGEYYVAVVGDFPRVWQQPDLVRAVARVATRMTVRPGANTVLQQLEVVDLRWK